MKTFKLTDQDKVELQAVIVEINAENEVKQAEQTKWLNSSHSLTTEEHIANYHQRRSVEKKEWQISREAFKQGIVDQKKTEARYRVEQKVHKSNASGIFWVVIILASLFCIVKGCGSETTEYRTGMGGHRE